MSNDLSNLIAQLITNQAVPESIRQQFVAALMAEVRRPCGGQHPAPSIAPSQPRPAATKVFNTQAAAAAIATRKIVYVHGICRHVDGFSDELWATLKPQLSGTFGDGTLGQTRLEVVWSDLVNEASASLGFAMAGAAPPMAVASEQERSQASAEIKEALRDRADQQAMHAAAHNAGVTAGAVSDAVSGGISIPGLNCIDDFSIYLTSDTVRQQILDRFIAIVSPQLQAGVQLDIISHSWGAVVAYEGLRQLEDEGLVTPLIRNWFTVGAALSIGPVKTRLRPDNQDGRKPASVQKWINLDARGDLIGGPLKDRPFQVDLDFLNLDPVGCGSFFGLVNPSCAHGSYFVEANLAVNRDIFAHFINS